MLVLIAFAGAAIIALLLWRAMNSERVDTPRVQRRPTAGTTLPRTSGPDDDPEFLRQLDEKVKRRDDPPSA
ncbi:hypothetical protein ACVGVM_03445 [Pseudonocardia bannensis]|uniref:Uncharacterized protein n=1 Tax=Pseudonocardia bannensis TaxID=630973 RepID=A0A848DRB3_9PSEU|nr:hypothetical protein [Pseudonocardia bannensis]NMH95039.1 hypothetical protein [Pseudonocardia bannensis]